MTWSPRSANSFYKWLSTAQELPQTASPGPGDYMQVYETLAGAEGVREIVSIHMTAEGSGAYQAARVAASMIGEQRPDLKIAVIDTRNVAMCQGWMAIEAARAARQGKSLADVVALVERMLPITRMLQTADTLKYLYMGGRIGRAKHLAGSVLNIKPLISVEDGVVVAVGTARGRQKAYQMMADRLEKAVGRMGKIKIAYVHAAAQEEVEKLKVLVEDADDVCRVGRRRTVTGAGRPLRSRHGRVVLFSRDELEPSPVRLHRTRRSQCEAQKGPFSEERSFLLEQEAEPLLISLLRVSRAPQVGSPGRVLPCAVQQRDLDEVRLARLAQQRHIRLLRRPVGLDGIAGQTGRCQVGPGPGTTARLRHDVVQCQPAEPGLRAAVLASVAVAGQNGPAAQRHRPAPGRTHPLAQTDHRRLGDRQTRRVQHSFRRLHRMCLFLQHQRHSASQRDDVHGFVGGVQQKDGHGHTF